MPLKLDALFDSFPVLESERLRLRQLAPDDTTAIFAIYSDPKVMIFYDMAQMVDSSEGLNIINYMTQRFIKHNGIRWGILLQANDTVIGTCGINHIDPRSSTGSIGYDLAHDHWGHGYATEAVRTLLTFAFETVGFNRIESETMLWNVASMRLLRKLGFTEEGILREFGYWLGTYHDLRMHSLLRREWERNET